MTNYLRIFLAVMVALLPAKYAQAQCDAPTSVATGEVTTDGATISWDESATADSYTVSYRVHGDVDWTEAANSLTTTSYTFTGLVQGTSYDYRVQAVCGGGASAWTTSGESPFQVSFKPPLIKGAVFGGGRMANVEGKTTVEVKECQAIGSVFGGNDIAGEVEDADGATITLGTGNKTTPIIIGSVYGGGNGYYYYPSIGNVICNAEGTAASALAAGNVYGYWSGGSGTILATLTATTATTAPQVQKTLISVESDRVYIDSLFGGAKNAIISGDDSPTASDTTVSIRIKGGTVFSVFGGNNYGGFLADNTTQHIYVENTKALSPNSSVKLGGIHNTGVTHTGATIDAWAVDADAHSICYVFGGGNKVPGQNVHIEVKGGQIDTCFGGGNSADVRTVLVDVNVTTPKYDLAHSPYTDATTYAYSPVTSVFDIRCLFGGNNAADMSGLPTLNLTQGGVHNVYGGGNRGVMKGAETYSDNYRIEDSVGVTYYGAAYTPSYTALNGENGGDLKAKRSTNVVVNSANFIADTIYGGGQSAGTDHDTYVEIIAGNVGVVYGGTNIMGRIGPNYDNGHPLASKPRDVAKTNVYIHGGTVYNSVFGGSNGYYRCHNGEIYNNTALTNAIMAAKYDGTDGTPDLRGKRTPAVFKTYVLISDGATVKGSVFSSGNMAPVGRTAALDPNPDSAGIAILHIIGGTIGAGNTGTGEITTRGAVYGGGNMGNVYGGTDLRISGTNTTIFGDVYGGNNKTGRVFATLRGVAGITELSSKSTDAPVDVLNSEFPVLPGTITGAPNINTGSQIALNENNASTHVLVIETPKIWGSLYGGGNGDYAYVADYLAAAAYTGDKEPVINGCSLYEADQRSSFVDVNLTNGGYISKVFGGGNSKTVGRSDLGSGHATVYMNCADVPAADLTNVNVGSIFGGNNNVDMARVPRIVLLRGKVEKVYGGGNLGKMTGNESFYGLPLSTFVALPSNEIVITKDVYAGCNAADVTNHTYVKMRKGKVLGDIFGGNDAAGEVKIAHVLIDGEGANTRVDGSVYGGGNGNYAFYEYAGVDGEGLKYYTLDGVTYKAPATSEVNPGNYFIGTISGEAPSRTMNIQYHLVKGRPYVDSTDVVLKNNMVLNNVYGGGVSGDCRKTRVWVDAENGVFDGMIFGAGKGRVDNMGLRVTGGGTCKDLYIGVAVSRDPSTGEVTYGTGTAMGNVLDTAFLTVSRFKSMRNGRSAMFGGGQSGHVGTTYVEYQNTAVNRLKALYLGCLASDVKNAAIGVINAYEPDGDVSIIDTIYGGNDFTGRVEHTYLTINSGKFVHVFGAGNGDVSETGVAYTPGSPARNVEYYKEWIEMSDLWSDDGDRALLQKKDCNCYDTVPYSMDVNITINGGEFLSNVYGGGNMGLVGDRDMTRAEMAGNETGRHSKIGNIVLTIHDGNFHRHVFAGARGKADMKSRFFDSWETTSPARADAKNVDNGIVGKQLAYAQKIVNMDGGFVHFSVYGGSEAVDDGFPYECGGVAMDDILASITTVPGVANANTTLRPSSILNITGGRIEKSVYGGGYQGNIYGSVYVNIGIDAVRDCPVWNYTNTGFAMSAYKPNLTGHSGYNITNTYNSTTGKVDKARVPVVWTAPAGNPTLQKAIIDLEASVYNASDWGEAGDKAFFNTRGVYGGKTNILIDGKGYYTSLTDPFNVDLPSMDIAYSIIGAGTSTDGGDVNKLITMRHYGDYFCPEPSKKLYSIQRADKVVLDSVFLDMFGDQDAYSAYVSPSYSFCRIDTLIFRIDNIITMESPSLYVGNLVSMKTDEVKMINDADQLYSKTPIPQTLIPQEGDVPAHYSTLANDFFDNLPGQPEVDPDNPDDEPSCRPSICETMTDVCTWLPNTRGEADEIGAFNVLMMRNGSYMKVAPFIDINEDGVNDVSDYGHVNGWMYLLAQDQTMSYVYAEPKTTASDMSKGGFVSPCYCNNFNSFENEIDYINVTEEGYRTWKVGTKQGSRVRHITLVANVTPDGRLNNNLTGTKTSLKTDAHGTAISDGSITVGEDYAYATTILELPPADGGNFYVLNSVLIDQDNGGQMHLLEQGYDANNNIFFKTDNAADYTRIATDPDYTFGLIFSSKENFDNTNPCWGQVNPSLTELTDPFTRGLTYTEGGNTYRYPCWKQSIISGNRNLTLAGGYISNAIIANSVGAIPTMQFTLTYNKNLTTTINRDVIFTLYEFDKNGVYQGPVEVTVTIATVIKTFGDLTAPVLAMFNEGVTNEYVRKITIPAGFLQRDIYIEGIEWGKDDLTEYDINEGTGLGQDMRTVRTDTRKAEWFYMEQKGDPPANNNHFSIIVKPTESSTENMSNNTLGWYHIEADEGVDVFKMAADDYRETTDGGTFVSSETDPRRMLYNSLDYDGAGHATNLAGRKGNGIWLGTLDGRATASVDIHLNFNGLYTYHKQLDPPLAWITLKCHYYNTKIDGDGTFDIKIKLRTRDYGDTIYLAPEPTLTRRPAEVIDFDGEGPGEPELVEANEQITLYAYGYGYHGEEAPFTGAVAPYTTPNYNNIDNDKYSIKNDPRWYLTSFKQAMDIYDEGDVLCIMETMPIENGAEPISIMGDDYSVIQIIRYSGSHFSFPTLGCANKDAMIDVKGNGFLTMRNIWFNGSGCTRVKPPETGAWANGGFITTLTFTKDATTKTLKYYENHPREKTILWSKAPIIFAHQGGTASFVRNIKMTNNFSNYDNIADDGTVNQMCGGAIALVKDAVDLDPEVTIGQYGSVYDNVVLDIAATNNYVSPYNNRLPRNYGGAVYVNGGRFTVGTGIKDTEIEIARNFYLKSNDENSAAIRTKTAYVFTTPDESSVTPKNFEVYYLDTVNYSRYFSLSNVYLTRVPGEVAGCSNMIRKDKQSDLIYFLSEMTPDSRIGVSKWFPGYRYENSGSLDLLDNYDDTYHGIPRDTIAFARIGQGKSNTSLVDNNYTAGVFFNDSSYTAINGVCEDLGGGRTAPAFVTHDNVTAYSYTHTGATSALDPYTYTYPSDVYENYKDKVFIYRHTSLAPYNIYFQRCASFGKGVHLVEESVDVCWNGYGYKPGDSISYHWNEDATCALANDTIKFRVGGGFYPYTYSWSDITDGANPVQLHTRRTAGSNAISTFGVSEYASMRRKAEFDTLVFRLSLNSSGEFAHYRFKVVATDLTGNCPVEQDVLVDVQKVATDHHDNGIFLYDYENFLLNRRNGDRARTYAALKEDLSSGITDANDSIDAFGATIPDSIAMERIREVELFYRIKAPGVDSSSFHDHEGHTPRHDLRSAGVDPVGGGLRRAGYTHIPGNCNEYDGTNGNSDFSGLPYKGDGSCDIGDMTPRYMRVFRSFKVKPSISPHDARGDIVVNDYYGNHLYTVDHEHMDDDKWSPVIEVCPGEPLQLRPSVGAGWEFVGWNFDPSQTANADFVVQTNTENNNPIIFYVPGDYWWQHVTRFENSYTDGDEHTATLKDYELDYYGDVTIRTNKGLAWLISTVNGYNGQNAQTFHFNTITIDPPVDLSDPEHPKRAIIDMQAHKWTPLGNVNNPFEGTFTGTFVINGGDTLFSRINNILLNETTIPLVGMFGHTRGATIKDFVVDSIMTRGNTYVSAICGEATENTVIENVMIQRGAIFGEYCIGGFISHMLNSSLLNCRLSTLRGDGDRGRIKAFGNAIYAGGFVGLASGSVLENNAMQNRGYIDISLLSSIYVGAFIGYNKDTGSPFKSANRTIVNNNFAQILTSNTAQRVGGMVGYAEDLDMNNNYVHGETDYNKQNGMLGGIAGYVGSNVSISNCYFVEGMAQNIFGYNSSLPNSKTTTFTGSGNHVILKRPIDGYTNMTRALNAWVRDHGDTIYNYWRSDFTGENSGLPLFGEPDIIPVNDTLITSSCDNFEFDGLTFDQSGIYIFHVVDSSDFVDSTLTVFLTINYGDTTQVVDTINFGEGYEGHGFSLSADELRSMSQNVRIRDVYALQFIDSLQNANGCDSLVVLTLYIVRSGVDVPEVQKLTEVKVYPNPTLGLVNVEGSDLESIEVYDNISRRVLSRKVDGDRTTFDLSQQAAGSYYVRVRTANGTVVKKVIKK